MSAQSKAMYWQARAMELEAMVERMAKVLKRISCRCDDRAYIECQGPETCKGADSKEALAAYAAMKGGK